MSALQYDGLRKRFISTYSPPHDIDPHELVSNYETYVDYVAQNPHASSYSVASAIEAPRGRVRTWMEEGGKPDVVRGVNTADSHGWFATQGPMHLALTRLVAGVFAGGSIIEDGWTPTFSSTSANSIRMALKESGSGVRSIKRGRNRSGDELRPQRNASMLGRILYTRGATLGRKTTVTAVPEYLFAPDEDDAAESFLKIYVQLRGVQPEERDFIQILEQNRKETYHDDLHELFDDHLEGTVSRRQDGVMIPKPTIQANSWLFSRIE